MQYCPTCETELPHNAHFCRHCGRVLVVTTTIDGAMDKRCSFPAGTIEQQDTLEVPSSSAAEAIEQRDTLKVQSVLAAEAIEQRETLKVQSLSAAEAIERRDTLKVSSSTAAGAIERRETLKIQSLSVAEAIEQQDTLKVQSLRHKALSKLPMPVQHVISALLTRARDPEPEAPAKEEKSMSPQTIVWGWLPAL